MATTLDSQPAAPTPKRPADSANVPHSQAWRTIRAVLAPVASLKLTVVLFAMSIFIVLAGTLAQVNADIWQVVDQYFRVSAADLFVNGFPWIDPRALFVKIEMQLFFPASFFPSKPVLPSWMAFPFPKGWLIGAVMVLNLFAAHTVRFKVQAAGNRLWGGIGVLALGALVTTLVVLSGSNADGFQGEALLEWSTLWSLLQVGLLILAASAIYAAFSTESGPSSARWLLAGTAVALIAAFVWTVMRADSRLDDAYMRILYQLVKGTLAGLVLLGGCIMVFKKRAGIVLIHAGVGLIMLSELLVGVQAEEAQMRIEEGASSNFVEDIRTYELALISSDGDEEHHIVVPANLLVKGQEVSDPELPVDIKVVEFYPSARVVPPMRAGDAPNPATAGIGKGGVAVPLKATVGTDTGGGVDMPAAYVQLRDQDSQEDLGTYLVSTELDLFNMGENRQTVTVDGTEYEIELRFKRSYKPYVITLNDIRKEDYIGTSTPRDYSSFVKLEDAKRGIERDDVRIWMNNPLRYAGETFYQSSYHPPGSIPGSTREWTSLQVVKNSGWMIPYVACMIVFVGMFAQFGVTLMRFLRRHDRVIIPPAAAADEPSANEKGPETSQAPTKSPSGRRWWGILPPLLTVLIFGGYLLSKARPPKVETGKADIVAFSKLPIVSEGRPKPIDTLARNTLLILSDSQELPLQRDGEDLKANWEEVSAAIRKKWPKVTAEDVASFSGDLDDLAPLAKTIAERSGHPLMQVEFDLYELTSEKQPAVRWLLDVIADRDVARYHRVFKIENLELQKVLGLERRSRFRYAIAEFGDQISKLSKQLDEAHRLSNSDKEQLSLFQRKLLDFGSKLQTYRRLQAGYTLPNLPPLPDIAQIETDPEGVRSQLMTFIGATRSAESEIQSLGVPLTVPYEAPDSKETETVEWMPFSVALLHAYVNGALGMEIHKDDPRDATIAFNEILASYAAGDVEEFNKAVAGYRSLVTPTISEQVDLPKVSFETFFNHFSPFYYCAVLYLVAFALTCLSWLGWTRPLGRSAFWLMCFTLLVRTFAISARIPISGRPPVTNL